MRTVPLHGAKADGRVALVDDEDYELVMQHRWNVREKTRASGSTEGPYAMAHLRSGGRDTTILMHNLIMGHGSHDHRNHDGLDNQRHNLRPASRIQNGQNSRKLVAGTSRYKGVTWHKQKRKYCARIRVARELRNLGSFSNEEEAARAYDSAAREAFGEFACLNFPD